MNNISIEKIHEQWLNDCDIDEFHLDRASIDTPKLHAKYLRILDLTKQELREKEFLYSVLYKKRIEWYDGELTKEEMDELEWKYDPYDGKLVNTKQAKDKYIKGDRVLNEAKNEIEEVKNKVETLKEILENVKWRHMTIKNAIEFKKFEAGF